MQRHISFGILTALAAFFGPLGMAGALQAGQPGTTPINARQEIRTSVVELVRMNQNPRAALAARQKLRDQVCVAMADRRINTSERKKLLGDAGRVLKKEELAAFEQWLAQLSPLPKRESRPAERIVEKVEVATTIKIKEPPPEPAIPETIVLPDRIASIDRTW